MVAALVMSGEQSQIPRTLQQFSVAAKDSFEVALNMACAAVLDGQLQEAQRLLQLAETKGMEVLTDEGASQAVHPPPHAACMRLFVALPARNVYACCDDSACMRGCSPHCWCMHRLDPRGCSLVDVVCCV
jgi:hypothetical protein